MQPRPGQARPGQAAKHGSHQSTQGQLKPGYGRISNFGEAIQSASQQARPGQARLAQTSHPAGKAIQRSDAGDLNHGWKNVLPQIQKRTNANLEKGGSSF